MRLAAHVCGLCVSVWRETAAWSWAPVPEANVPTQSQLYYPVPYKDVSVNVAWKRRRTAWASTGVFISPSYMVSWKWKWKERWQWAWDNYSRCMNFGGTVCKPVFLLVSVIVSGLKLVESYPYETVQRDYDYVRLASITAGKFTELIFIYSLLTFYFCSR